MINLQIYHELRIFASSLDFMTPFTAKLLAVFGSYIKFLIIKIIVLKLRQNIFLIALKSRLINTLYHSQTSSGLDQMDAIQWWATKVLCVHASNKVVLVSTLWNVYVIRYTYALVKRALNYHRTVKNCLI